MKRTPPHQAARALGLATLLACVGTSAALADQTLEGPEHTPSPVADEVVAGKLPGDPLVRQLVIVGAGAAGSAAAFETRGVSTLVLEKESTVGGRIRSQERAGITYETGALFGVSLQLFPQIELDIIKESGPIGLYSNGRLTLGQTAHELITNARQANSTPTPGGATADPHATVVEAFFNVIHPGPMDAYAPARRNDAFATFATDHFADGNSTLVSELLSESRAEVRLGAQVVAIEADEKGVTTQFVQDGKPWSVRSRAVIVTPPAPVAARLIRSLPKRTAEFLASVSYGSGTVVSLIAQLTSPPPFRYAATPELAFNSVFVNNVQRRSPTPGTATQGSGKTHALTIYFAGRKHIDVEKLSEEELIQMVTQELAKVSDSFAGLEMFAADVKVWDYLGTIISEPTYAMFADEVLNPLPGIFLAGDYTWWDEQQMPFGVTQALASGKRAAKLAMDHLEARKVEDASLPPLGGDSTPKTLQYAENKLTSCTVFRLTEDRPVFQQRMDEGNIAYYGLILNASRNNRSLAEYLLSHTDEGLWEYENGYGHTAPDSALALEGLVEAIGTDHPVVQRAAELLVELYLDEATGGFRTMSGNSRAAYWLGPSVETTAMVAHLLHKIDPDRYAEITQRSRDFLRSTQQPNGSWQGKWFPSRTIPTYYALRALALDDKTTDHLRESVSGFLLSQQAPDGSFSGSVIETSAGLLAMKTLRMTDDEVNAARHWLARQPSNSRGGEPLLYYWFEDAGEKTFFSCTDRGEIASAWRRLALAE